MAHLGCARGELNVRVFFWCLLRTGSLPVPCVCFKESWQGSEGLFVSCIPASLPFCWKF